MKRIALILLVLVLTMASGCMTVKGMAQDISSVAGHIDRSIIEPE